MKRASISYDEAVVERVGKAYGIKNISGLVRLLLAEADRHLAVDKLAGRVGSFGAHTLERTSDGERRIIRRPK